MPKKTAAKSATATAACTNDVIPNKKPKNKTKLSQDEKIKKAQDKLAKVEKGSLYLSMLFCCSCTVCVVIKY